MQLREHDKSSLKSGARIHVESTTVGHHQKMLSDMNIAFLWKDLADF